MTPFQEDLYRLIQEIRKDTNPFTTVEQDAGSDVQRIVAFSNKWDSKEKLDVLTDKYEKLLKSSQMDKQLAAYHAIKGVVKEMIPIIDEAYILSQHVDEDSTLGRAVQLVISNMENILTRRGGGVIKPSINDELDPSKHKAVVAEEVVGHRGNTISEVYRYGYYVLGKVIREAEVKVTCGVKAKV